MVFSSPTSNTPIIRSQIIRMSSFVNSKDLASYCCYKWEVLIHLFGHLKQWGIACCWGGRETWLGQVTSATLTVYSATVLRASSTYLTPCDIQSGTYCGQLLAISWIKYSTIRMKMNEHTASNCSSVAYWIASRPCIQKFPGSNPGRTSYLIFIKVSSSSVICLNYRMDFSLQTCFVRSGLNCSCGRVLLTNNIQDELSCFSPLTFLSNQTWKEI